MEKLTADASIIIIIMKLREDMYMCSNTKDKVRVETGREAATKKKPCEDRKRGKVGQTTNKTRT